MNMNIVMYELRCCKCPFKEDTRNLQGTMAKHQGQTGHRKFIVKCNLVPRITVVEQPKGG